MDHNSIAHAPDVSDYEFAMGLCEIPEPPSRDDRDLEGTHWPDTARGLIATGLGTDPRITVASGVDTMKAIRFVGAMMATVGCEDQIERFAGWLQHLFIALQPHSVGPTAMHVEQERA